MATEAELRYVISVQDRELRELRKQLKETGDEAGKSIPKGVDRSSKSLDKLNRAVNVAGAALVAGLFVGGKKAEEAATNLGEQVNKATVVFGKSAPEILAWGETTATAIGISNRQALEAAGVFGNMLKPMGLAPSLAADMSRTMVDLGADMASFNNASPEETLDALRAGLAGETEPLRRFGVFLNAARVEEEALRLGLVKQGEELDAAAKAQATYSLIMKDTADAQGDFARTSDSNANRQRIMRARLEDTAAAFGNQLIPVMSAALGVGIGILDWTGEHQTATKVLIGTVVALVAALKLAIVANRVYTASTTAGTLANRLLNSTLKAQRALMATTIVGALVLLGLALIALWKKSETFRRIVHGAIDFVREGTVRLRDAGIEAKNKLVGAWDAIKRGVLLAVDVMLRIFDKYLGGIEGILHVMGKLPGPFGKPFRAAEDAVEGARRKVSDLRGEISRLRGKRVHVTVDFSLRATAAKPREGFTGGDVSGADGIVLEGLVGTLNRRRGLLTGVFPGARRDVDPRLWHEIGLAHAFGLAVGSTYRPGSRVRGSGARSDHSFYPSKAIDVFGPAAAMRAYALAVAGSPGVDTVIHSGLGRGRGLWKGGWGPILSQTTYDDHFDHVHVDTFDRGGWLPPRSATLAINRTNMWEPVGPPGARAVYVFNFPNYVGDQRELAAAVRDEFDRFERRNGRRP